MANTSSDAVREGMSMSDLVSVIRCKIHALTTKWIVINNTYPKLTQIIDSSCHLMALQLIWIWIPSTIPHTVSHPLFAGYQSRLTAVCIQTFHCT